MKVGLDGPLTASMLEWQRSGTARSKATENTDAPADTQKEGQFCSPSNTAAALEGRLQAVPEVRQQRVEALRNAISAGTFRISPQRIADAMLAESAKLRS